MSLEFYNIADYSKSQLEPLGEGFHALAKSAEDITFARHLGALVDPFAESDDRAFLELFYLRSDIRKGRGSAYAVIDTASEPEKLVGMAHVLPHGRFEVGLNRQYLPLPPAIAQIALLTKREPTNNLQVKAWFGSEELTEGPYAKFSTETYQWLGKEVPVWTLEPAVSQYDAKSLPQGEKSFLTEVHDSITSAGYQRVGDGYYDTGSQLWQPPHRTTLYTFQPE
jgi:hypothetical protein